MSEALVRNFFAAADSRNPQELTRLLTEDVAWTFGNWPTTRGRQAVIDALTPFFSHVVEMRHRIVGIWQCGDCITAETRVTYRDQFGRDFEFPGCDLMFLDGELFRDIRIFVDNHEMFLPPAAASQV